MVESLRWFVTATTRESNWDLHPTAVRSMLPWIFTNGKIHYSLSLLFNILKEIISLSATHPATHDQFVSRKWTVQQQDSYGFSGTASDQVVYQNCNQDFKELQVLLRAGNMWYLKVNVLTLRDRSWQAPNDTTYMRWSCHSGLANTVEIV